MRSEPTLVPARPANRAEAQAAAHPALSVEVVSTVPGLRALRADYERLDRATGNTLPFCLHEWHVSWCETFIESGAKIRDEPRIHVLRTGTGQCVGIVPMILTERRVGPFTVRSLDALGSDPALTEIRSPLIERGYETAVARALQAQLMRARDWDWVAWRGLDTAFGAALAACAPLRATAPLPDYVLDLPGSWETLHAGLKRNIRESLRHCYNSLKSEGHAYALRVNETPDDIPAALERFLVLHRLRAAMAGTVAHPDRFSGALLRRFLLQVCTRLAERGAARVFELVIGGEVVASRIGFVVGGTLYLYYSGFEPRWARYGVMTTTQAEAIKYAIACGLRCVNLSPGTDVGKTRWGPRVVHYGEAVQVGRSLRSRLARAAYLQVHEDRGPALWLAKLDRRSRRKWS